MNCARTGEAEPIAISASPAVNRRTLLVIAELHVVDRQGAERQGNDVIFAVAEAHDQTTFGIATAL